MQGYVSHEVVEFYTEYMKQQPIGVPLSWHEGRLAGYPVLKGASCHSSSSMVDQAHLTVLHHTSRLSAYEDEHLEFIKNRDRRKKSSVHRLNNTHNAEYIGWLKDRLKNGPNGDVVTWLVQKPSPTVVKYQAYDINGTRSARSIVIRGPHNRIALLE